MSKPTSIAFLPQVALFFLALSMILTGCSKNDTDENDDNETLPTTQLTQSPGFINYPYYNDLELLINVEDIYAKQEEWQLGSAWGLQQGNSNSPQWHLEFSKPGSGLGSFTEGTALLETVIPIPEVAAYPTLSFWHQLHLEKSNHSVVVEAQLQKIETTTEDDQVAGDADEIDWFVLKRFYESDNTEDYMQVTVDLSPYVGQSLRFRLRTVERSENAEEASGVKIGEKTKNNENKADSKSSVSGVFNGNNNENASDNARKNANKPGKEAAPENVELIQASAVKGKPDDSPYVMWRVDDFSIGERDTDKDGVGDAFEVRVGTEPNDPESVPDDSDNDGIPDVINAMMGVWSGPCRYVGGGEYIRETLLNTEYIIQRNYESSFDNCRTGWVTVSKNYEYSFKDMAYVPGNTDAKIDLELKQVTLTPSTNDVAEALNRICSKHDFVGEIANDAGEVTCAGDVVYPKSSVIHYDLIRQRDATMWFGDQLDVTDPLLRSTVLDLSVAFHKAEAEE